jgi:hypothetical protein
MTSFGKHASSTDQSERFDLSVNGDYMFLW